MNKEEIEILKREFKSRWKGRIQRYIEETRNTNGHKLEDVELQYARLLDYSRDLASLKSQIDKYKEALKNI